MHITTRKGFKATLVGVGLVRRSLVFFKQFRFANTLTKSFRTDTNPLFWPVAVISGMLTYFATQGWYLLSTRPGSELIFISDFRLSTLTSDSWVIYIVTMLVLYASYLGLSTPRGSHKSRHISKVREFFWLAMMGGICGVALLSSSNLIAFYTAIEGLSLVTFFLIARHASRAGSKELFFKYFCFSSYSSVLLGGGFGLLYLLTQSLDFSSIKSIIFVVNCDSQFDSLSQVGVVTFQQLLLASSWLVILGFMFKLGSFPFHFIVPDIYEASSLLFLTFYNFVLKQFYLLSLILVLWAIFSESVPAAAAPILIVSGCGSLVVGTLGAYIQRSFWRFLGYASVAQTGLVVLGLAANTLQAASASLVFFWGYLAATLLVLVLSSILQQTLVAVEHGGHLRAPTGFGYISEVGSSVVGLTAKDAPAGVAALCAFCASIFSFAALPPFVGFVTKYVLILQMVRVESLFLAVLVVVLNLLSTYYYLRVAEQALSRVQLRRQGNNTPVPARLGSAKQQSIAHGSGARRTSFLLASRPASRQGSGARLRLPLVGLLVGFVYSVVKLTLVSGFANTLVTSLAVY